MVLSPITARIAQNFVQTFHSNISLFEINQYFEINKIWSSAILPLFLKPYFFSKNIRSIYN